MSRLYQNKAMENSTKFYVAERLSKHREKTPEGYLLCKAVPISRVGTFEYAPSETGIPAGPSGIVEMTRTAEELFSPDTMASFEGKPIVVGHDTFADPSNWSEIAKGHIQNVRRGEGPQRDLLLADLLIQKQDAIDLVESGELTEVSCGYDATAVDDGGGKGHQAGIVGNHLALVKKARCGELCHIGDGLVMSIKTKLRRLFRDGDEDAFNEALDRVEAKEIPQGDAAAKDEEPQETEAGEDRLGALEKRLAALEEAVGKLSPPQEAADEAEPEPEQKGEEEAADEEPAGEEPVGEDPAPSEEEAERVLADAESLCPGVKKPQGDGAGGKLSAEDLRRVKRAAIAGAGITMFGDAGTLGNEALDVAFIASVADRKKSLNPVARGFGDSKPEREAGDLNETFRKFWNRSI